MELLGLNFILRQICIPGEDALKVELVFAFFILVLLYYARKLVLVEDQVTS